MQNDYDQKLFSSATKTSTSLQPIVTEVENRTVTQQQLSQRSEPANDTNFDKISNNRLENISIEIPNDTLSNNKVNGDIENGSNYHEGVFFATPVNVRDEMNSELVNQDIKEERIIR